MTPAAIFSEFDIDPLSTPATIEITGDRLRGGMILVDDLGTPSAGLDHKVRATRGSGDVSFLAYDFDACSLTTLNLTARHTYRVVAE